MGDLSIPAALVVTLVCMIFTGGITWGVTVTKQKSDNKSITAVINDLKIVVGQLQGLATDVQVAKAMSARSEKDIESLDERVRHLETEVAKLSA